MREKRTLPAHVDGRIKIGPFTVKGFVKWIPFFIVSFFLIIKFPSQGTFIFGLFTILLSAIPFMEFRFKQTGWDFLKEFVKYDIHSILADFFPEKIKHKSIIYERSEIDDSIFQKLTFNQAAYEVNHRKREQSEKEREHQESSE